MSFCSVCGKENNINNNFCMYCGSKINSQNVGMNLENESEKMKLLKKLNIINAIIYFVSAAFLIVAFLITIFEINGGSL